MKEGNYFQQCKNVNWPFFDAAAWKLERSIHDKNCKWCVVCAHFPILHSIVHISCSVVDAFQWNIITTYGYIVSNVKLNSLSCAHPSLFFLQKGKTILCVTIGYFSLKGKATFLRHKMTNALPTLKKMREGSCEYRKTSVHRSSLWTE